MHRCRGTARAKWEWDVHSPTGDYHKMNIGCIQILYSNPHEVQCLCPFVRSDLLNSLNIRRACLSPEQVILSIATSQSPASVLPGSPNSRHCFVHSKSAYGAFTEKSIRVVDICIYFVSGRAADSESRRFAFSVQAVSRVRRRPIISPFQSITCH